MNNYNGRVVIITGAGSGMGRAMVEEFAARQALVVALDINLKAAEESISKIANPEAGFAYRGDVSDPASVNDRLYRLSVNCARRLIPHLR